MAIKNAVSLLLMKFMRRKLAKIGIESQFESELGKNASLLPVPKQYCRFSNKRVPNKI